ncbi:phosphatidylinositol-4-phosphate 5-kinase [Trypanosoma rangeli]|uniref:Phosphatidylinositol-4-phosphate 5-kinase n=1 Tax=Trypanosoma rangeli TaxID=5698 RepID=A0A3R7RJX3_TRYRA|nr:phosphatidylinositol-4-phosphate 5-kinase [Trypanosoma rangeli]RNF05685.1 phosphatidylinositol-4-phosphate 5-kinase [Trypanosoma rangeli]|eukprot:RNF05685.1 phosphatidylinositol-4-phosphate 5-kinase [Trypanosoma rangeli]
MVKGSCGAATANMYGGAWQDGAPHSYGENTYTNGDTFHGEREFGKRSRCGGATFMLRDTTLREATRMTSRMDTSCCTQLKGTVMPGSGAAERNMGRVERRSAIDNASLARGAMEERKARQTLPEALHPIFWCMARWPQRW